MNDTLDLAEEDDGERNGCAITFAGTIDELVRLAGDLVEVARLFDNATPSPAERKSTVAAMTPHQFFASLLDLRRMRARHFRTAAAARPECDIMLQLMLARVDGREIALSRLAAASAAPAATRRQVEQLIEARLAERIENPADYKDFLISLSSDAALRLAQLYRLRTRG
jgi:hypothetical protein